MEQAATRPASNIARGLRRVVAKLLEKRRWNRSHRARVLDAWLGRSATPGEARTRGEDGAGLACEVCGA